MRDAIDNLQMGQIRVLLYEKINHSRYVIRNI